MGDHFTVAEARNVIWEGGAPLLPPLLTLCHNLCNSAIAEVTARENDPEKFGLFISKRGILRFWRLGICAGNRPSGMRACSGGGMVTDQVAHRYGALGRLTIL